MWSVSNWHGIYEIKLLAYDVLYVNIYIPTSCLTLCSFTDHIQSDTADITALWPNDTCTCMYMHMHMYK